MSCDSVYLPFASISSHSLPTFPFSQEGLPFHSCVGPKLQTRVLPPQNIKSFQSLSSCGHPIRRAVILSSCINGRFLRSRLIARIHPPTELSLREVCFNRVIRPTQLRAANPSSARSSGTIFASSHEGPPTKSIGSAVPAPATLGCKVQSASTVSNDLPAAEAGISLAPWASSPPSTSSPSIKPKSQLKADLRSPTTSRHRGPPTSPSQGDLILELRKVASLRRRGSDLDQCISKVLAQQQPKTSRAWTKALEGIGRLPQGGPDLAMRVLTWLADNTEERVTERQCSNLLAVASRGGSTDVVERVFALMARHQVPRTTQVSLPCGWLAGWPVM